MFSPHTNLFSHHIGVQRVCPTAFQHFWNITEYTRRKIEKSIKQGESLDLPHGNCFVDRPDPKSNLCFDWLAKLCQASEHQPDSGDIHTIARCLKIEMFEDMRHDLLTSGLIEFKDDCPSYPLFLQIWRSSYPHLKIPKSCRLGRCDECVALEEDISSAKGQKRDELLSKKARHRNTVKLERAEMRRLQHRAIEFPDEWTSVATDW